MDYDDARGVVVLFGGTDGAGVLHDDTWEYDGATWVLGAAAPPGLVARHGHDMAYHDGLSRMVLFGGRSATTFFDDTWLHDGNGWSQGPAAPPGLVARTAHAMAFRASSGQVVLHGGFSSGTRPDTWLFDGAWSAGPGGPPRGGHAMAYDAARDRVVIQNGTDGVLSFDDTWELVGTSWTQGPAGQVRPRYSHDMDYLPSAGIVLFGGYCYNCGVTYDDTWLFDGNLWASIDDSLHPPGRSGHRMATDVARERIVLFGGNGSDATVWEYRHCPITIEPGALMSASVGRYYTQWISALGGTAPYGYSVASGALPPGLSLSSDGHLSGTPTASGPFSFTIQATDAAGCTGSHAYQLLVCTLAILPSDLDDGVEGVGYLASLTITGGTPPYTVGVGGVLPAGLALDTASWTISGTPTDAGVSRFDIWLVDAAGCYVQQPYTLAILAAVDHVVGQGLGQPNGNRVRAFGRDGVAMFPSFLAYGAGQWGVNVSGGNIDGGPYGEILTGPGPGALYGPQVRGWSRAGAAIAKVNFYAYGTLRYGASTCAALLDADAPEEILTGAGPGSVFGPHARAFDHDGGPVAAIQGVSFFAYGTLRWGVNVGRAELDLDGFDEILTGPGPGPSFAAQVRAFDYDGTSVSAIGSVSFFAFPAVFFGASVAGGDVDGDGWGEIVAAKGPGAALDSRILGFDVDGAAVAALPGFDDTPFATAYGARVGSGDLEGSGSWSLQAGAGRDPAADATVEVRRYANQVLTPLPGFLPFPGDGFGVNVAAGALGYF